MFKYSGFCNLLTYKEADIFYEFYQKQNFFKSLLFDYLNIGKSGGNPVGFLLGGQLSMTLEAVIIVIAYIIIMKNKSDSCQVAKAPTILVDEEFPIPPFQPICFQ